MPPWHRHGFPTTAGALTRTVDGSGHEVLGARVVAHQRHGGLLGVELEPFAHLDTDPVASEQFDGFGVVVEVGAGRVAPGVAAPAVLLAEQARQARPVLLGEAPLLADAP